MLATRATAKAPRVQALRTLLPLVLLLAVPVVGAGSIAATELVSPSFRLRGAHEAGVAATRLDSAGPRFSASGAALGQSDALGFSTAASTLSTAVPGFWPLTASALPSLDLDGDAVVAWLDDDDDGDGLADAVETGTGVFVSEADTGSDPALVDTDGDGFGDGAEVAAGSDPNDPDSVPAAPEIPVAPAAGWMVLILSLLASPLALRRRAGGCR
jgi:hypothetical protein